MVRATSTPSVPGLLLGLLVIMLLGYLMGEEFGYGTLAWAWFVHFLLMVWMLAVEAGAPLPYDGRWYQVRTWEPPLYQALGVYGFMRLLRAVGWEWANRQAKKFDGTRASLPAYERGTRSSEFNHAVLAGVGLVMVAVAVFLRAWDSAAWLLGVNVFLHMYPVMLQRTMRSRVQVLLKDGRQIERQARAPRSAPRSRNGVDHAECQGEEAALE
ncbi:hypothetical protein [Deinococcus apachensis]|uniref:glycosyl-4,4'-diaponeurosporenoate acyltransferase CrtO family protein n=1 Tax=Deinococcus apachensis TaxID=309886 RepID=UPI0012FC015C|nr:hypothetical protein [Deinococcus apachensis]